jgi:hypothetical protein
VLILLFCRSKERRKIRKPKLAAFFERLLKKKKASPRGTVSPSRMYKIREEGQGKTHEHQHFKKQPKEGKSIERTEKRVIKEEEEEGEEEMDSESGHGS